MIIYVSQNNIHNYRKYIHEYYVLRKKVFCDNHGWVTPNPDGTETDHIDKNFHIYILYISTDTDEVVGGVRLSPSTGLTLTHTVWSDLLPDPDDFRSPNLWEVTRFCVDETRNTGRLKNFVNRIFLALMVAILDFAHENGITSLMAVCESRFIKVFESFSGGPEVIAKTTESDGCEISFVVWPTNGGLREAFSWARSFTGGTEPIRIQAA